MVAYYSKDDKMKYSVDRVFGVSNDEVLSYIERKEVDGKFKDALETKKHIIVFGSSKQGKTALVTKQMSNDSYIRINCSPDSKPIDIYQSLLRQIDVEITDRIQSSTTQESDVNGKVNVNVKIPFFVDGKAELGSSLSSSNTKEIDYKIVEYNLSLPQDIAEILKKYNFNKRIVLDNFHYLSEEVQKSLAFDLRVFEDYNVLFIILGIWREKNRLSQFNGDLQDRIFEVPVEPWTDEDFRKVVTKGSDLLRVNYQSVLSKIIENAFDSIGVFQELLKHCCIAQGIQETQKDETVINKSSFETAVIKKVEDYSGRHIRSFEAFIEQKVKTANEVPLYMHYYFVKMILTEDFRTIQNGIKRKYIQEKIQQMHHRAEDVRASDLSYFLHNITQSQIKRTIIPPLFDYDRSTKVLKIIDSTLYFFLRNADRDEVLSDLPVPEGVES